ncbi:MAG: hypothetical protein A3F90_09315 [Deltaproteobacteria bacterium RIFCSPLOWO2_12_FULL_60_19]|nr:MAG: hypothetical protein A3F90_09315 [Deltaproteobacteria bacterium RIFCSPLOWO2_12_FULL_60_19]
MALSDLPGVNAALNTASALLLATGYLFIRKGRVALHRLCMLSALLTSTLFLASYLVYHYNVGSVPFRGQGWIRVVYFTILISHTILAIAILPLVLITVTRALKGNFERHKRIARWTLPLWFYVSVTGVIVYWMLYKLSVG